MKIGAVLAVVVGAVVLWHSTALPREEHGERSAYLHLDFDGWGEADVFFSAFGLSGGGGMDRALAETFPCPSFDTDAEEDEVWVQGSCGLLLARRGSLLEGSLDLSPLLRALEAAGVPLLSVGVSHPLLGTGGVRGFTRAPASGTGEVTWYGDLATGASAPALEVRYGYDGKDHALLLALSAAVMLAPVVLLLSARRRAVAAGSEDPAALWFSFWRVYYLAAQGGWLLWAGFASSFRLAEWVRFSLPGASALPSAVSWSIYLFPPALASVLIALLSHGVFVRLRGIDLSRKEMLGQLAGRALMLLVPLICVVQALASIPRGFVAAFTWLFVAYPAYLLGLVITMAAASLEPHALTVGALRDRAFELAAAAGVRLRQVYLLPAMRLQMANAFASRGDVVILTDYLLRRLDRREVDAVLAHELAHLSRRDPQRMVKWLLLLIAGGVAAALLWNSLLELLTLHAWRLGAGGPAIAGALRQLPLLPAAGVAALAIWSFARRRMERLADVRAADLTGDPESLVTSLVKLTRLNLLPLRWGKWFERISSHPATETRARLIAAHAGIGGGRLAELLECGLEGSGERYGIPPSVVSGEGVFTSRFRFWTVFRNSWIILLAISFAPVAAAGIIERLPPPEMPPWPFQAGGAAACLALLLLLLDVLPAWGYGKLKRRLVDRAPGEAGGGDEGIFVGFAPHGDPRLYEGHSVWDVGFLYFHGDRLVFRGEKTRFALTRERTADLRLCDGVPSWWGGRAVRVTWRDDAGGTWALAIKTVVGTMRRIGRETEEMFHRCEKWRAGSPPSASPGGASPLPPPPAGEVTSSAPGDALRPGAMFFTVVVVTALQAWALLLAGLGRHAPFTVATGLLCLLVLWLPTLRRKRAAAKEALRRRGGRESP